MAGAIDELVGEGVPASNVEIREVLLPILDVMPEGDDLPQGFDLVLREIDRYLADRTPRPRSRPTSRRPPRSPRRHGC